MENSHLKARISAVIFDLDGTLLNTEQLTKNILKEFLAKYGKEQDNEKERKRMGVTFKESSVMIIKDYDLPLTPEQFTEEIIPMYYGKWQQSKPLPGVNRLMKHLRSHGVPFALASNSLRKNIDGKISNQDGWKEGFSVILGSDQVKSGKPSPDLFLEAAKRMGVDPLHCLVIEDSLVGVKAGKAAVMNVVAVPSLQMESESYSIADLILHSLLEFQPEQWDLPPFGDWIDNILPIEPIHLAGVLRDGLFQTYADNGVAFLPDQIWGLYIGWAKFDGEKVLKAVISIGWSIAGSNSKRKIFPSKIISPDMIWHNSMGPRGRPQLVPRGPSRQPGQTMNDLLGRSSDRYQDLRPSDLFRDTKLARYTIRSSDLRATIRSSDRSL